MEGHCRQLSAEYRLDTSGQWSVPGHPVVKQCQAVVNSSPWGVLLTTDKHGCRLVNYRLYFFITNDQ